MRAIENENQKLKSLSNKIPSGKKVKWVVCKISHLIKNNEKKGTILPKKLTMMKDSEYWSEFYRGKNMEMYAEYGFEKMEKPTKPIFKKMEIKPSQKTTEKPTTNMSSKPTNQIVQTNTQNKSVKPQINIPTQFSVSWREELPSGKVEQNTYYFPSYEEWEKFVNSN